MTRQNILCFCAALSMALLTPAVARALPGDDLAVEQHCGQPTAENNQTSPVTGKVQRDLYYGDTILHFEPTGGGWSFDGAWQGNFPISRAAVEKRMPCLTAALAQVASAPKQEMDPTIASQTVVPQAASAGALGIPFLWIILGLAVLLIVLIALPSARKQNQRVLEPRDRPSRAPDLSGFHKRTTDRDRLDR